MYNRWDRVGFWETSNYKFEFNSKFSRIKQVSKKLICLNYVDSDGLESLRVIDPILSSRTIKIRDALGGFYSVDKLKGV